MNEALATLLLSDVSPHRPRLVAGEEMQNGLWYAPRLRAFVVRGFYSYRRFTRSEARAWLRMRDRGGLRGWLVGVVERLRFELWYAWRVR